MCFQFTGVGEKQSYFTIALLAKINNKIGPAFRETNDGLNVNRNDTKAHVAIRPSSYKLSLKPSGQSTLSRVLMNFICRMVIELVFGSMLNWRHLA